MAWDESLERLARILDPAAWAEPLLPETYRSGQREESLLKAQELKEAGYQLRENTVNEPQLEATINWVKKNYAWEPGEEDEFVGQLIEAVESLQGKLAAFTYEFSPGHFFKDGTVFVQSGVIRPRYVDTYVSEGGEVLKRLVGEYEVYTPDGTEKFDDDDDE